MTVSTRRPVAVQYASQTKAVWLRLLLFLAPCVLLSAVPVYVIDPYDLFGGGRGVISEKVKVQYATPLDQPLWKLAKYDREPVENILLGDSQMARLAEQDILSVSGRRYFNLAYGGGTLRESVSTFWHAAGRAWLQSVYFGISFMSYNGKGKDRIPESEKILHNPINYFYDGTVLQTAFYDALSVVPGWQIDIGPQISLEAFWKVELDSLKLRYSNIISPEKLKHELRKIVDYCGANGIQLTFVITPTHVDAQNRVIELGVVEEYATFKRDLASLAPTLDYDIASEITQDRSNYAGSPFHLSDEAAARVVTDIWRQTFRWGRKLSVQTPNTANAMKSHGKNE
jgi:hypothetical protein